MKSRANDSPPIPPSPLFKAGFDALLSYWEIKEGSLDRISPNPLTDGFSIYSEAPDSLLDEEEEEDSSSSLAYSYSNLRMFELALLEEAL